MRLQLIKSKQHHIVGGKNMPVRDMIHIDEEKCNGCGDCITSCAEGALQLVNGKAKLVSEIYCDGLGACLGKCPTGALTITKRDCEDFNEEAVEQRLSALHVNENKALPSLPVSQMPSSGGGCPGTMVRQFQRAPQPAAPTTGETPSALTQWPIQLHLMPVQAPYLQGAELLIAADCVPFAYADFHSKILAGKKLLIGCPKLDDNQFYTQKLTQLFQQNDIKSISIAFMEVPCCFGLVQAVVSALRSSGKDIPLTMNKISIQGSLCEA